MMHNLKAEMQGKCRRLFYDKTTGDVIGVASGGGALEELTGDDLVIATFNDLTAPQRIGCIEEFYNPIPPTKPLNIQLAKIKVCSDAVDAHRAAKKAEADFVLEKGITLFGNEPKSTADLRRSLKVAELRTRGKPKMANSHTAITSAQTELETLVQTCETASEQLLSTRDDAITFASQESN